MKLKKKIEKGANKTLVFSKDETLFNALYLLSGGYNDIGRHINLNEYNKLKEEFESILYTADKLLK